MSLRISVAGCMIERSCAIAVGDANLSWCALYNQGHRTSRSTDQHSPQMRADNSLRCQRCGCFGTARFVVDLARRSEDVEPERRARRDFGSDANVFKAITLSSRTAI
jgi:hypothetical protein